MGSRSLQGLKMSEVEHMPFRHLVLSVNKITRQDLTERGRSLTSVKERSGTKYTALQNSRDDR